jgi:2-phosphoglycerate kinase
VYWIGGGSGAGKSTIARRLAARHDLHLYDTDAMMREHAPRTTAETAPMLAEFIAMDMDERWLNRTPESMLDTFHWFRGEGFDLIVEDLLALPRDRPVIAEGFRLLPELVQPLLAEPNQAVWLLPTPRFRRAAFASRGGTWSIAGQTSNPERALANLLDRDDMFTERLRRDTSSLELNTIEIDTGLDEDGLDHRITALFDL